MTPARGERPSEVSFRSMAKEFAPRLYRHAYRSLGDSHLAAEAVQETLVRVHRSLPDFRGECALGTWIYRIAVNTITSYRRRRHNHSISFVGTGDIQYIIDEEGDLEEAFDRKLECERLARCIAKLSPRESAAITLFYMDGYGYKEIASILETSVDCVGLLLHRGREHLRVLLAGTRERGEI